MDAKKYTRSVGLNCPTCGCDLYQVEGAADETLEFMKCANCDRELTKDELLHENGENISVHVDEIGKQVLEDAAKEFKDSLKKAFRGSKFITIK